MRSTLKLQEESVESSVPICGGNFSTPVIDSTMYLNEVHYRIGDRLYIENAD